MEKEMEIGGKYMKDEIKEREVSERRIEKEVNDDEIDEIKREGEGVDMGVMMKVEERIEDGGKVI